MKKSLITLVAALAVGLSAFAGTGMYVKLKNGETFRHNVDDVEEVVFAEIQEQDPLKFKVLTDSTAEVTKENCVEGSVTIPSKVVIDGKTYSVVSIADYAFKNCKGLTNITIPSSVVSIEDGAFNGCKGLTNITIPSSVVKIGAFAFANSGLTTIELPSSITSIDYGLFSACSDLVSVKIPSSVESIGQSAFVECTSLTNLELSSNLKSIGDMAFYNCTGLTNLQLSVESIGIMAFYNCTGLTNLQLSSSVKSIGSSAFFGCENLDLVIDISEDNVKVASKAFQNCKSVTWNLLVDESESPLKFKVLTDSTAEVTKENCVEGSVTIPSKVVIDGKTYSVVSIEDDAFNGCKGLTNITIPSSVVKIGAFAFANSGLTTIELPSSITSIDYGLFSSCSDLVSVKIPSSVESIGQDAFLSCTSLTNLELSSNLKSIGDMAFYNCTGLTNLQLSVESIGIMAFDGCTGLTNLQLSSSVKSIGSSAFRGCENLDLVIDNSEDNVKVASKALQDCKSVTWKK